MTLLRTIWSYCGGLILFVLAVYIGKYLVPAGVVYGLFIAFWKHRLKTGLKGADRKFLTLATALDIYGNVACAELFNHLLIHWDSPHKFGTHGMTISAVIGLNLMNNSLSKPGHLLADFLDFWDEDHCYNAAQAWLEKHPPST